MLPSGPQSTYQLPSTTRENSRDLAQQILGSIRAEIAKAGEVRPATQTTGCDGLPLINTLDGSTCNGVVGGSLVLINPATRTVLTPSLGRAFVGTGGVGSPGVFFSTIHPVSCAVVLAKLKARRRFTDNLGNVYGPTGLWLGHGDPPATLETDYVQRVRIGRLIHLGDPGGWNQRWLFSLEKTSGAPAYLPVTTSPQGMVWPSVDDQIWTNMVTIYNGRTDDGSHMIGGGLDDCAIAGSFSGTEYLAVITIDYQITISPTAALDDLTMDAWASANGPYTSQGAATYDVAISALAVGGHDKYHWRKNGGSWSSDIDCIAGNLETLSDGIKMRIGHNLGHTLGDSWTIAVVVGDPSLPRADTFSWYVQIGHGLSDTPIGSGSHVPITTLPQSLTAGISVQFASKYGHTLRDWWTGALALDNTIVRDGIAVRGTIDTATPCVNGGFPNSNVLLTTELTATLSLTGAPSGVATGSHALVVRDANTLVLLYRKPLLYNSTAMTWGDPPQKFSFSTNDEGLFFLHCYTTPSLASPPTPYPGAEFGSPNPRVVAVVSVNPITFEPTITELITLQDSAGYTDGASFATAKTV